jgi:hypothetical protein
VTLDKFRGRDFESKVRGFDFGGATVIGYDDEDRPIRKRTKEYMTALINRSLSRRKAVFPIGDTEIENEFTTHTYTLQNGGWSIRRGTITLSIRHAVPTCGGRWSDSKVSIRITRKLPSRRWRRIRCFRELDIKRIISMANKIINTHFSDRELDCRCGCGKTVVPELLVRLEALREKLGRPVSINSGARCETYNRQVRGEKNSWHLKGLAADIACSDSISRSQVIRAAIELGFNGIGIAESSSISTCDRRRSRSASYTTRPMSDNLSLRSEQADDSRPMTRLRLTPN